MAKPPAPAAPVEVWTGPDRARIGWAGVTAAPAVTSWVLRVRTAAAGREPAGGWTTVEGIDAGDRARTVVGLAAGTGYEAQAAAVNDDGRGPWSPTLAFTTQEDETVEILQSALTTAAIGIEAVEGTAVAATRQVPYRDGASLTERVVWSARAEKGTVRAEVGRTATGRGTTLVLPQLLSPETLVAPLLCSMAQVSSSALSGARRWTFAPSVAAVSGLATATVEIAQTDGASPAHRRDRKFGFARCTALEVSLDGADATFSPTWMGRASEALAAPADVAAPDRWIVPTAAFAVHIDDTWAALGTTQVGKVRSGSWSFDPGVAEPENALAGRANLDVPYWLRQILAGALNLVVDHDSAATGEQDHYLAGDLRYVRLEATNGLAGANLRRVRIDSCVQWTDPPNLLEDDSGLHRLSLSGALTAADGNFCGVELVNGMQAW